jgi:hypothetical protein
MKKFIWFLFISILCPILLFSQKTVKVKGYAQMEIPDYLSRQDAKKQVEDAATLNALERAFGSVLVQGNSTYITNVQTGMKTAETNVVFNTVANRLVKGKVEEVIKSEFQYFNNMKTVNGKQEPVTEIRCDIEIEASEITAPKINFTSFTLNCENEKCQTTDFRNRDKIFMFFSSPMSGYISIYLTDEDTTNCLYPYHDMPADFEGGVPVVADEKYILFSAKPEFNYFKEKNVKNQQYFLFSDRQQEIYIIYIIFSKTPITKPPLWSVIKYSDGSEFPKSCKSEDFQNWLNQYKSLEKANVEVKSITVTVAK